MKREILFRGKRIDNGECVYGTPIYPKGYDKVIITTGELAVPNVPDFGFVQYEVIPKTVGQWTGLTDKNGKKIFEHDRVKYKCGDIAEVIFTEYGAFVGETESLFHENIGGVLTEVIGTIFDKEVENG